MSKSNNASNKEFCEFLEKDDHIKNVYNKLICKCYSNDYFDSIKHNDIKKQLQIFFRLLSPAFRSHSFSDFYRYSTKLKPQEVIDFFEGIDKEKTPIFYKKLIYWLIFKSLEFWLPIIS